MARWGRGRKYFVLLRWLVPAALVLAVVILAKRGDSRERGRGLYGMTAGFSGRAAVVGGAVRAKSTAPRSAVADGTRLRAPSSLGPSGAGESGEVREVTIERSSAAYGSVVLAERRSGWKYLTRSVREGIDGAEPEVGGWDRVVVHGSSTESGGAEVLGDYHRRVRGLPDGLAYHFVIGNGSLTGDGEIEIGGRWTHQVSAARNRAEAGGSRGREIAICLVGDFNRSRASQAQIEALDELVDYLEAKVGEVSVEPHRTNGWSGHGCPGRYFPIELLGRL